MHKRKKGCLVFLSALLLLLFMASSAAALDVSSGDTINLPVGPIKGPLFVSGNNITVNADVDGDVFAAGETVNINGTVNGDVIAVANTLRIKGNIWGDVRAAANSIDMEGQITGSFTGAANTATLGDSSNIERDVLLFASISELLGNIDGQLLSSGSQINLNGIINSDVTIWSVQNLILGPAADIKGSVTYTSVNPAQIDYQAQVEHITQLTPAVNPDRTEPVRRVAWLGVFWSWTAGILIWAAFGLIFPQFFPRVGKTALEKPWAVLGWGFLTLILTPLAALVLAFTLIGIPLVLISLTAYIVILCLAKIMTADLISRFLVRRYQWKARGSLLGAFIVSFLALILLTRIPVLSFFLDIIIASMALGMLVLTISQLRGKSSEIQDQSAPAME